LVFISKAFSANTRLQASEKINSLIQNGRHQQLPRRPPSGGNPQHCDDVSSILRHQDPLRERHRPFSHREIRRQRRKEGATRACSCPRADVPVQDEDAGPGTG